MNINKKKEMEKLIELQKFNEEYRGYILKKGEKYYV